MGPASAAGCEAIAGRHVAIARTRLPCAVLVFEATASVVALADAVTGQRGELLGTREGVWAAMFSPIEAARPVARAGRAAEALIAAGLASRALVDRREIVTRTRADGSRQVLTDVHAGAAARLREVAAGQVAVTDAAQLEEVPARSTQAAGTRATETQVTEARATPTSARAEPALVGRDELLGELVRSARAAIEAATPARVTVLGDDGAGRTRLGRRLADELRGTFADARVVWIGLREQPGGTSFEALRVVARAILELPDEPPEDPGAVLGDDDDDDGVSALAHALGWLPASAIARLRETPGAYRGALVRVLAAAIGRACTRPLLVVVDDTQFADAATLDAIRLASDAADRPLWWCLTSSRPLWDGPARHTTSIALPPLAPADAGRLCRELLLPAVDVPEAAIERLVARTRGSPRDLVEVCRALHDAGAIRPRTRGGDFYLDTGALADEYPLGEWLRRRELALDPDLHTFAAALALLAPGFSAADAGKIFDRLYRTGRFSLDPGAALDRLRRRGVIDHDEHTGSFRFPNGLLRQALAGSLAPELARHVHAAAAAHYDELARARPGDPGPLARLAPHAAATGDRRRASAILVGLADASRELHDYVAAEALSSRALELLDDDRDAELRLRRARAVMRYRLGRHEDALADYARARALARAGGDAALEAELLLDEATALDWMAEPGRSAERVAEARALVGPAPGGRLAVRLGVAEGRSSWRRAGEGAQAIELLERALAAAEPFGDEVYDDRIAAMVMLLFLLATVGRLADADAIAADAIALCERRGDRHHLMSALNNRQFVSMRSGKYERAIADLERSDRIGAELGIPSQRYRVQLSLADIHRRIGDLTTARRHAERAREMERDGSAAGAQQTAAVILLQVLAMLGEHGPARELLGAIARDRLSRIETVQVRAVELALEDAGDAAWDDFLDGARATAPRYLHDLIEHRATAARRRGQHARARELLEQAEAAAQLNDPVAHARLRAAITALEGPG